MTLTHLNMIKYFITIIIILVTLTVNSQTWKSYTTQDNINIEYLRDNKKKMFFVKIIAKTNHTVDQLLENINDVENYNKWVSYTTETKMIKKYGNDSLFYYTINQPPFPLGKKDAIFGVYLNYKNDGSVHIYSKSLPDKLPKVDGYDRVDYYIVIWEFIPKQDYTLIKYYLELEYPPISTEFILSQFIRKGPEESIRKFIAKMK